MERMDHFPQGFEQPKSSAQQAAEKEARLAQARRMKEQVAQAGGRLSPEEREEFSSKIEAAESALKQELLELYETLKTISPNEYESAKRGVANAAMDDAALQQKREGRTWASISDARREAWDKTKTVILGVGMAAGLATALVMLRNTPTFEGNPEDVREALQHSFQWLLGAVTCGYATLAALGLARGTKFVGDKLHDRRLWKERTDARDSALKERGMEE